MKKKPDSPKPVEPVQVAPAAPLTLTPVEFSPAPNPDAVGWVMGALRPGRDYPLLIPLSIVLLALIYSSVQDIVAVNRRMTMINNQNVRPLEMLQKSSKQIDFRDSMRAQLHKLALTDPIAASVEKDFFPPPKTDPAATKSSAP